MRRSGRAVVLTALLLVVVGCDDAATPSTTDTTPPQTTTTTTSTTVTSTTIVPLVDPGFSVYFLISETENGDQGPFLVPVHRTWEADQPGGPTVAVQALLLGPEAAAWAGEVDSLLFSEIPPGTNVLEVTWDDGVANVDLSGAYDDGAGSLSMLARLAQVTYTLTQFDDIDAVTFSIDGDPVSVFSSEGIDLSQPVTRETFADLRPPLFVETPAWGSEVTLPLSVSGIGHLDGGTVWCVLGNGEGQALPDYDEDSWSSVEVISAGDPPVFECELDADLSNLERDLTSIYDGELVVWEPGPDEGAAINVITYPLRFAVPPR